MAVEGDRAVAGLLSALAEAPDVSAAASYLLTQIVEVTSASRACLFRLDAAQDALIAVATLGFDGETPALALPIGDLSNPLTISARALAPIRGRGPLGPRA